ncbi:uncharacterized protein LOC109599750 [Aethina tumida]|uniref:uncharacterized protein LOC109599750 n=1 Tax=Aethina tumida TaxID=116153 RepID=UPI0021498698|nr:uncharacterized protein LOC109599750 [Aethina tumida]
MHMSTVMKVKRIFLLFLTVACLGVLYLITTSSLIDDKDRGLRLKEIDQLVKSKENSLGCMQPHLPVYPQELMKFVKTVPKIDCSKAKEDWVKCVGHTCTIQEQANIKYGPIKCSFTDIIRVDDFKLTDGKTTHTDKSYTLKASDVVRVSCTGNTEKWSSTLLGIRKDQEVWDSTNWDGLPENALKMNVLMFGFDSISRNSFIRKLPNSYAYFTDVLDGIVLKGYNIIGDGTPQALIPILTGKTELELPDTRKRVFNSKFVNAYPFVWNDYRDAGYVTGFFEDVAELGTFTYRLNGFKECPVDHYMRTYYVAALGERRKWPKLCAGEIPRHKVMMNAVKDFYTVYKPKPKFLFAFHGELSHDDYNLVGVADDDLNELLQDLNGSGALNNTILILMADHGHRFAEIRNTLQGKQEERLPFFAFRFPRWFKEKHKRAYDNFKANVDKLTTPLDIHDTLQSVLHLDDVGEANLSHRSVSLFTKIPAERSCADAYIEPHWCACLQWENIPVSDPIVERLAHKFVTTLNEYTTEHQDVCDRLAVSEVMWVTRLKPNEKLLKFNKNADLDGFVGEFSAKMDIKYNMYQIKVMLTPGKSIFEASFTHFLADDRLELKLSDVSRINMYGRQARCIENEFPNLRKYCYCKDELP